MNDQKTTGSETSPTLPTEQRIPVIAVIGRPNVGKSTLFNKLVGYRRAVVQDTPGVTRDRNIALCHWRLRRFTLIDTAGMTDALAPPATAELGCAAQMQRQVELALDQADILLFMIDGRAGVTPEDEALLATLRRQGKPIYFVINKTEAIDAVALGNCYRLGCDTFYPISAEHNHGIAELLDALHPQMAPEEEAPEPLPRIIVLGRPNAGKSTLINRLLGEERLITSAQPGTTRDTIDAEVVYRDKRYLFIDTAGLRRRGKIEGIEFYSVTRAKAALEHSDVALLLIDGVEGITDQDTKIAGLISESGKGLVLVINKSDIFGNEARRRLEREIAIRFSFLRGPQSLFISAKTAHGFRTLFEKIDEVYHAAGIRVSTGDLNRFCARVIESHPPPLYRGRMVRIYYMTQVATRPPTFVLFVNAAAGLPEHYLRYLDNRLRATFGFGGAPIRIKVRTRTGRSHTTDKTPSSFSPRQHRRPRRTLAPIASPAE